MPARLLFLFPFLLLLVVSNRRRTAPVILAAAAGLFALADQQYFLKLGYLNKGYLIPFGEIARMIESESDPVRTLVLVDSANSDPAPLQAVLPDSFELWIASGRPELELAGARIEESPPEIIWYLRTSRDVTPRRLHERFEESLAERYAPTPHRYLPYSAIDQTALSMLGATPPSHHFQVIRYDRE